jgi:hypothetical protein
MTSALSTSSLEGSLDTVLPVVISITNTGPDATAFRARATAAAGLTFDFQPEIARRMGWRGRGDELAVERFMRRYFQVAQPGLGWGGTDIDDPLSIIQKIDAATAWPGLRLLLTSTTGEDALYCLLDENLVPMPAAMPEAVRQVVDRIGENCEPSLCSVLFMAGAGGSLRAGVSQNPVLLTRSVARGETRVTLGGAPAHVWTGGGITVMADVTRMPKGSFGSMPTPAIVAPIEFTLPRALYAAIGGHAGEVVPMEALIAALASEARIEPWSEVNPWPKGRLAAQP